MSNVLIVYATREGQTKKISHVIAKVLREHGHTVELVNTDDDSSFDVRSFDCVFIGAPIHAGGYPRSIPSFIRAHKDRLSAIPMTTFFSVGLGVASKTKDGHADTMEMVNALFDKVKWRPTHVELVAGALPYSKYNWLIRLIMRRISASNGGDTNTSQDYEYTDWPAVEQYAIAMVEEQHT